MRVPQGGIQPQVAVDAKGAVHMIYFNGDTANGNLYYVRSDDSGATFSHPIQINSPAGTAVAMGNIRGAQLAIGRNGRVHVSWMGSQKAQPRGPNNAAPMLYTRMNDSGGAFEPERNMIHAAYGLDGGGSVAADTAGNVYVLWHAPAPGTKGEENRRVWIARSSDDGKSFDREKQAFDRPTGACGCCGMRAFADAMGDLYVLYRSAMEAVNRDMYLLFSRDHGAHFQGSDIHKWNVGYCVMSTESFTAAKDEVLAAWETEGQVYYTSIAPGSAKISPPVAAPGPDGGRKHPAVAANARDEALLVWTEGMAWKKGGSLAWQIFDKKGQPEAEKGQAMGVPAFSLVAAFSRPDGGFTIVY